VKALLTRIEGPKLLAPIVNGDHRGFFAETYRESVLEDLDIRERWVQENHSRSLRGVVRGLHFQIGEGQAKLVSCARGAIFDVVVDLRPESATYGDWEGHELNDEELHQLYVPIGLAHGFCVTSEVADVVYKCSSYYDPSAERAIRYDDPDIGIDWPVDDLVSSERDASAPSLAEVARELNLGQ
jgi:dTDP-4-dehydrorhamnose 3,5-epimerase